MRDCPATQAYIVRRTAEGKTVREIKRYLKRYITRQLYRTLTASMMPTTKNPARRPRPAPVLPLQARSSSWSRKGTSILCYRF